VWLGYPEFESVAAIGVALLVLFVSYRLGRRTIDALMDRVPHSLTKEVERAIASVEGMEELRKVRIRTSGAHMFVDAVVAIRRTIPFQSAHTIMDNIERAVHVNYPNADVVVHAEPFTAKDETIIDKIRMIVMDKGLRPPHNIEVHLTDGKYFIDFDVEYAEGKSFTEAHEISSEIEQQIMNAFKTVGKVTIHMEEYHPSERMLTNVTDAEIHLLKEIQEVTEQQHHVFACKDLTLLKEGHQYNATLTCQIDKTKTLDEVHQIISDVEAVLFRHFKQLRRIMIHAEPK
jgi:divalent metal cation (Fe/Co/Zn/Cd) transporter